MIRSILLVAWILLALGLTGHPVSAATVDEIETARIAAAHARMRTNPVGKQEWGTEPVALTNPGRIYTSANAPATPTLDELTLTDTVSQYGITWHFSEKVRVGRFITNDYYVVGPCTVVAIDPKPLWGDEVKDPWYFPSSIKEKLKPNELARNGSMVNPANNNQAAFDSRIVDERYDAKQFARLPIQLKPGSSLISSISDPVTATDAPKAYKKIDSHYDPVMVAAVLTCLDKPQPPDAFRPSYKDRQSKIFLARNLRRELLHSLPRPKTTPDLNHWIRLTQQPWIDFVEFSYAAPNQNMAGYGQMNCIMTSVVGLMLHLDFPAEQKEPLLLNYVQIAIDLYGSLRDGYAGWPGHGGHGSGRKWPQICAAMLFADQDWIKCLQSQPAKTFGEDHQTHFGSSWYGSNVAFESHPKDIAWPNWNDMRPPQAWSEYGHNNYRRCCTSVTWPGQTIAARLMGAESVWKNDAYFAYVDRYMQEDNFETCILVNQLYNKDFTSPPSYVILTDDFQYACWMAYRHNLPGRASVPLATTELHISPMPSWTAHPDTSADKLVRYTPTTITLASTAPGAEIRFTRDGSEPTRSSPLYNAPFIIDTTTTIKAKTFRGDEEGYPLEATYVIVQDAIPPQVAKVVATGFNSPSSDPTKVRIVFSEPLDRLIAQATNNYRIDNGVTITAVETDANNLIVTLTTSPLTSGTEYHLSLKNLKDRAGNVVAAQPIAFRYELDSRKDLIGHWSFDGDILDRSGYAHDAIFKVGAKIGSDVRPGNGSGSLELSGGKAFLQLPVGAVNAFKAASEFTVACWVKWDGSGEKPMAFIFFTPDHARYIALYAKNIRGVMSVIASKNANAGIVEVQGKQALEANTWVHLAVTLKGQTATVYRNGVEDFSGTITVTPSEVTQSRLREPERLYIGRGMSANWLSGWMDELRIYNRALTAADLGQLLK
ncbi:MAG: LamG-like jellyroll fold domain-containing protein [Planctomycetota bacterium]